MQGHLAPLPVRSRVLAPKPARNAGEARGLIRAPSAIFVHPPHCQGTAFFLRLTMLCATAIRRLTTGPIPQHRQRSVPLRNVRLRTAGSSGDAPSSPAPAPTARVRFRLAAPTAPASSTGEPSSDSASATSAGSAPKRLLDAAQQLASAAVDYTQGKLLAACTEALSHLGRISKATEATAGAVEGLRKDERQASADAREGRKEQAEELVGMGGWMDGTCYSLRGARNGTRDPHFNQWDFAP